MGSVRLPGPMSTWKDMIIRSKEIRTSLEGEK